MKKLLAYSLFFWAVMSSCSKSTDTTVTPPDNTTLLSANAWQTSKVSGTAGITVTVYTKGSTGNLYDFSKFKLTFGKDGKYQGVNLDGSTSTGTWKFTNSEKTIVQTDGTTGEIVEWNINTLTSSSLVLQHFINVTKPGALDKLLIEAAKTLGITANSSSYLTAELIP